MPRSATLTVMIKAVEKAANRLKRDYGEVENLQVSRKGPADFVSIADKKSEETLFAELSKARPEYAFLMEEQGAKGDPRAEYRWIVDPLDGTNNFLHGIPHWAISVALENRGMIIAGVVYDPIKDELYYAEKGGGAFLNSKRLRVSARKEPLNALCGLDHISREPKDQAEFVQKWQRMSENIGGLRQQGSAALGLAYVAAGRHEIYFADRIKTWDFAAGSLLVTEAGGEMTRWDGKRLEVQDGSVLASNGKLHRFALTHLNETTLKRALPPKKTENSSVSQAS